MRIRNLRKKILLILAVLGAILLIIYIISLVKSSKKEKAQARILNQLISDNSLRSFKDQIAGEIYFSEIAPNNAYDAVFSASMDEKKTRDIFSAKLVTKKNGEIKNVVNLINLSNTADAEESVYDVNEGWVAFVTQSGANCKSVSTVRTSGSKKKYFAFKPDAKKVELEWEGKNLKVIFRIKDEKCEAVIDPINGKIVSRTEYLKYIPEVKGKESFIASFVNFGRKILGAETVGWFESTFFSMTDGLDRFFYSLGRLFSSKKTDFGSGNTELPNVKPIITKDPIKGEGEWISLDDSKNGVKDPLMAYTSIRPDPDRPYAIVDLLYFDTERIEIAPVAGTIHPVSTTGIKGKGIIPQDDEIRERVLCAFSGGFQAVHGAYGMMVDGDVLLPAVEGFSTLSIFADGTFSLGVWGEDAKEIPSLVSYRQNLRPLIRKGLFNSENRYWGLSADKNKSIYVWRTGFGLTKKGKAIFAMGNSVSAKTLAAAMLAAGVTEAMHLDMNLVNVACELYTLEKDEKGEPKRDKNGVIILKPRHLQNRYYGTPGRYLVPHTRDFFYIMKKRGVK